MANTHNQKWQIATFKSGKYPQEILHIYYIYIIYNITNNNSNSYQSTNVDCEANASTINALGIDLSKTSINEVFGEYSF